MAEVEVVLRDFLAIESVCLDNFCASFKVFFVDLDNQVFLCDVKQVVVVLQLSVEVFESVPTIVFLREFVMLNLSSHSSVQNDDALLKSLVQVRPESVNVFVTSERYTTMQDLPKSYSLGDCSIAFF